MVAADDEDVRVQGGKLRQEKVKKLHRFGGRNRFIVNIPGDQHGVGLLFPGHPEDPGEDVFLVGDLGKSVDPLAEVQVGKVHQLHEIPPCLMVSIIANFCSVRNHWENEDCIFGVLW